jgi:hypothetical protein
VLKVLSGNKPFKLKLSTKDRFFLGTLGVFKNGDYITKFQHIVYRRNKIPTKRTAYFFFKPIWKSSRNDKKKLILAKKPFKIT